MKTRSSETLPSRPKGLRVLAFLGVSVVVTLGGVLALASSGREVSLTRAAIHDPLAEAKVAFVDGDLESAEKILRTISGGEAKTLLARVLLERGRCQEALGLFEGVLKDDPKSYEGVRGMAMASRRLGRLDLAELYWNRATELRKDDPRPWRELGLCQHDKGDDLAAMSSLQQSLRLDPSQLDLSNQVTELAVGKLDPARATPGMAPGSAPQPLRPRVPDPSTFVQQPRPPDPAQFLPKPPGRTR